MTYPQYPTNWESGTAGANGSTLAGYIDAKSEVNGYDGNCARYNHQTVLDQIEVLLLEQRESAAFQRKDIRTALNIAPKAAVKIMCCGDSITAGLASSDGVGYPGWMVDHLDQQNIPMTLSYNAHGGWEMPNVLSGLAAALTANTPDIVTLHIGSNDAGNATNLANFQANITTFLQQVLAFSPVVRGIVVALIPIAQNVDASYQANIAQCNTDVQNAVAALNDPRVTIADCTATTMARWNADDTWPGQQSPPSRHTLEGMHPRNAACTKISKAFLAAAAQWIPGYVPQP
jgi:lysophospholipase L1-like esterase